MTVRGRGVDIRELRARGGAGVAQLGQRRWDEVPVRNGSQVQILPPAPLFPKSTRFRLGRDYHDYIVTSVIAGKEMQEQYEIFIGEQAET